MTFSKKQMYEMYYSGYQMGLDVSLKMPHDEDVLIHKKHVRRVALELIEAKKLRESAPEKSLSG